MFSSNNDNFFEVEYASEWPELDEASNIQQNSGEIVPPHIEYDSDEIVPPRVEYDSDEIVPPRAEYDSDEIRPEAIYSEYVDRPLEWYDRYSTPQLRRFRAQTRDPYLIEQYDRVITQRERIDDDNTRELPQQNNDEEREDNVVRIDNNEDNMLTHLALTRPEENRRDFFGVIFEVDENNVEEVASELAREAFQRPYRVNMPLFLVVRLRNQIDGSVRFYAVRYGISNLIFLLRAIREPWFAWEHWRNTNNDYDSDVPQKIFVSSREYRTVDNAGMRPGVWVTTHIGFYNPEYIPVPFDNRLDDDRLRILWNLLARPNRGYLRRTGRFMKYTLDYDKVLLTDTPISRFWRKIKVQQEMAEKFQIPWFIHDDLLSEPEEGALPCSNPIFALPCFLYAIKPQIPTGIFEQIKNSGLILGVGVKTNVFSKLYEKYKIEFRVKRIWKEATGNNFKINTDVLPKIRKEPAIYTVKLLLWEEHYMIDAEYEIEGKTINFIRILEESKNQGLLKPINAFEFSRLYDNYSFDEMINFNYKYFIENTPRKYEFTESNYDKLIYKEKSGIPDIWFADFEATTDEEYHRPYLIVAKGFKIKIQDERMIYEPKATIIAHDFVEGGQADCALTFLTKLIEIYGNRTSKNKQKTACRVYFHNLHYDFTFILQYLKETKLIMKGNKLYSAKGRFSMYGKDIKIDFWDSLPIFQCSLKQAAETYLTKEQKKTIKKEIFPYNLYTFWNFATYGHYECPLKLALANLKEEDHEEFLRIVNSDKKRFLTENGEFAYKEYAIFYCEQDVNCLMWAMRNFADLLFGRSIEGVKGTPPFSLILWQYRTASSIGYEYFMRTVMLKKENEEYVPRYSWCIPKCELRALIQMTIRGGRVMVRDNKKFHWVAMHPGEYLQDYDFVSLYPTAMSRLWITEGSPVFIKAFDKDDKNYYTGNEFVTHFRRPEDDEDETKFSDGIIHVIRIWTNKNLHFPLLCIKDKTTKLNNYQNFNGEEVDIWVNAIDLFNLIDFQRAHFYWDAAIIWSGERKYEIRESIEKLFMFRAENKKHPVQLVTKLMLNSIFGKSILKPAGKQKLIVDKYRWRKNENQKWQKVDNFEEFFNANSYRINKIEILPFDKVEVEIFKRDVSSSLNIFGSNVLAMARRIIGRVMAMAEDLEEKYFDGKPNIFYTDTDSMHITTQLLTILEEEYEKKYNIPLKGRNMGNCHEDFDLPSNFKPDEYVLGASESYFLMKKVYMDKLIGSQGSVAYHLRMKGIPTDLVHPEDYEKIYNGEDVEFDLLNGHTRFFYKNGHVGSRLEFKRKIGLKRKNNE